jgi:putative ABC transport system ATP-binding protein
MSTAVEKSTDTMIRAENLWRQFKVGNRKVDAVKNVNMDIKKSSLTIFKGRSGSGKTTLMNLLGALDWPTKGKVFMGGEELTSISERGRDEIRRKDVGFVFQSIALIGMMSAYENVEFNLRVAGFPAKDRKHMVEDYLTFVGLKKRMHHRPHELSGGEQQRVAIARAVCHSPKVLFADEPTAELDTHTGLQVVKLFRELVEKRGLTVVMTTHDPGMMDIADKVYSLEDGEIVDET